MKQKVTTVCLLILITIAFISILGNWLEGEKGDLIPVNYEVVEGDTLWRIATYNKPENMSYEQYIYELRKANENSIENLKTGDTITILKKGD